MWEGGGRAAGQPIDLCWQWNFLPSCLCNCQIIEKLSRPPPRYCLPCNINRHSLTFFLARERDSCNANVFFYRTGLKNVISSLNGKTRRVRCTIQALPILFMWLLTLYEAYVHILFNFSYTFDKRNLMSLSAVLTLFNGMPCKCFFYRIGFKSFPKISLKR
jgi:hypothetical protein